MSIKNLLILGIIYSTLGIILLFQISPLLAVIGLIVLSIYLFKKIQREKTTENYWLFVALILALGLTNLYSFTKESTQTKKCLITNSRYPGTNEYKICVNNLTLANYAETLLSIRYPNSK